LVPRRRCSAARGDGKRDRGRLDRDHAAAGRLVRPAGPAPALMVVRASPTTALTCAALRGRAGGPGRQVMPISSRDAAELVAASPAQGEAGPGGASGRGRRWRGACARSQNGIRPVMVH
jgi:hypothetical protein